MPTWHSKGREEPSMKPSRGRSNISLPKSLWERSTKKESTRQFLTASRMMRYFMQTNYNITWQKNGANIWITLEQSIFRTRLLRNNWTDSLRCIIYGTIRNKWKEAPKKSRLEYHQTARAIVGMNKEAGQTQESKRRRNYREDLDPEKLDWLMWLPHN